MGSGRGECASAISVVCCYLLVQDTYMEQLMFVLVVATTVTSLALILFCPFCYKSVVDSAYEASQQLVCHVCSMLNLIISSAGGIGKVHSVLVSLS